MAKAPATGVLPTASIVASAAADLCLDYEIHLYPAPTLARVRSTARSPFGPVRLLVAAGPTIDVEGKMEGGLPASAADERRKLLPANPDGVARAGLISPGSPGEQVTLDLPSPAMDT
ncbi:MAG: hypothetical protein R3F36_16105 [Candidatus Competibacteraceae bacterium]